MSFLARCQLWVGFCDAIKDGRHPGSTAALQGSGVNASLLRLLLRLAPCQRCLCLSSCQGSTEQTSLSIGGVAYFDIADVMRIFSWVRIVSSQRVLCDSLICCCHLVTGGAVQV